jgi:hypothetical protein
MIPVISNLASRKFVAVGVDALLPHGSICDAPSLSDFGPDFVFATRLDSDAYHSECSGEVWVYLAHIFF